MEIAKRVYKEKESIVFDKDGKIENRTIEAWAIGTGDKNFTKTFDLFHTKILEDLEIMNGEAKLLLYLLAKTKELPLNTRGWLFLEYEDANKNLNVAERTFFRYLNKLLKLGYIEQRNNRQKVFRIKPNYVFRGVLSEYWKEMDKEPDVHMVG